MHLLKSLLKKAKTFKNDDPTSLTKYSDKFQTNKHDVTIVTIINVL